VRVHTYVIRWDAGSAPNYDPPFVTLTVCKPRIRRKAEIGDCVLAFAGATINPSDPHVVVWAGVVAEVIPLAEYWNDKRFAGKKPGRTSKPDNLYRPTRKGLVQVPNLVHGRDGILVDISGINALVFNPAWRFGAYGPKLPAEFGLRMVGGRRGERVSELSPDRWKALRTWLEATKAPATQKRNKMQWCNQQTGKPPRRTC